MDRDFLVDTKPISDDHSPKANNNLLFDDDDAMMFHQTSSSNPQLPAKNPAQSTFSSTDDFEHVTDDFLTSPATAPVQSSDGLMDSFLSNSSLEKPMVAESTNLVETLFTDDNVKKEDHPSKPFLENEFMQFSSTLKDAVDTKFVKPVKDVYSDFMDAERMHDSPEHHLSSANSSQTVSPAKALDKIEEKVNTGITKAAEKIDHIMAQDDLLESFTATPTAVPEVVMKPQVLKEEEPKKVELPPKVVPRVEKVEVAPKVEPLKPEVKPIEVVKPVVVEPSSPVAKPKPVAVADPPKPAKTKDDLILAEEMFYKFGLGKCRRPYIDFMFNYSPRVENTHNHANRHHLSSHDTLALFYLFEVSF